jgi:hypothetical protein
VHWAFARATQAFVPATESQPSQQKSVSDTPRAVTAQSESRAHFVSIGANRASRESDFSRTSLDAGAGSGVAVATTAVDGGLGVVDAVVRVSWALAALATLGGRDGGSASGGALHASAPTTSVEAMRD